MRAEYKNPNGTWSQGYYCMTCGQTVNMLATGHGKDKCVPNPKLVAELIKANK